MSLAGDHGVFDRTQARIEARDHSVGVISDLESFVHESGGVNRKQKLRVVNSTSKL